MKYKIEYNYTTLATVEIEESATPHLKEMVEFWSDWEWKLEENDDDYTKTWLKMLGGFILYNNRPPKNDEGWCSLDGSFGIKLLSWERYDHDEDEISIEEVP